ncbi:beta propeller repeat protein [Acidovorax sp. Q11]
MRFQALVLIAATAAITATAAEPPNTLIQAISGVYKYRFPNGTIDGKETWTSEDIVEIVPIDARNIYFRAELQFANGHICSLSGAASYDRGGFVYRDAEFDSIWKQRCVLRLRLTGKYLELTDPDPETGESTCRMYCGMRGSFLDYRIVRSSRRTIRYLPRLKASTQYHNALGQIAAPADASR